MSTDLRQPPSSNDHPEMIVISDLQSQPFSHTLNLSIKQVRERNRERVIETPNLNYVRKGYQQHTTTIVVAKRGERRRKNWRNALDVYSFYFMRFPKDMGKRNYGLNSKNWVTSEVFIAKKRNRSERRYGFVRFKGVDDVQKLERQLDNLIICGHKMHANLPKHGMVVKPTKKLYKEDQYKQGPLRDMQVDRVNIKDMAITAQTPTKGGKSRIILINKHCRSRMRQW